MRHLGRTRTPIFYAGFALELLGAVWALAATAQPLALRLAPLFVGYAIMVLAYWRARAAIRRWATPGDLSVWGRIGLRLLATRDLDAEFEPDPARRRPPPAA
jgi:hypothetical protein